MKQLLVTFLQDPTQDHFLAIRTAVRESGRYAPNSDDLARLEEAVYANEIDKAQSLLKASFPNLLLSPRAHLFAAIIARKKGDPQTVEMETFFANVCSRGIISTGDGSEEFPYLVLRPSDIRDVLLFLEKKTSAQSPIHNGERRLERVTTEDGATLYFDTTDAYVRPWD